MDNQSSGFAQGVAALLADLSAQKYQFTTVTPATHERVVSREKDAVAQTLRDAFGWNLPFQRSLLRLGLHAQLHAANVIKPCGDLWLSNVRVASLGEQLLVHSAYPTDQADAVFFGPDTYRFVAAISRRLVAGQPVTRAADIGCGTGAAGLFIARAFPKAEVFLGDINERALQFAMINAAAADANNVLVQYSDILSQLPGDFDFIVANPPYMLDAAQRAYRDGGSGHGTELSLRILAATLERLSPQGVGLIYTGAPVCRGVDIFHARAEQLLTQHAARWSYEEIDPDVFGEELEQATYADVERIAAVVIEFQKGE